MSHRARGLVLGALAVLLSACATTRQGGGSVEGRGDELLADSISMTGNADAWGRGMQLAGFRPGVEREGARCVEVTIPFGETAAAWSFSGLQPGAPVEAVFDVNVDFFAKEAYLYVACMPGRRDAREMKEPRDSFRSFQSQGWADGSAEWPDSTNGWQTVHCRGSRADGNGELTVVMIFGHPNENPPRVLAYVTNPFVRAP